MHHVKTVILIVFSMKKKDFTVCVSIPHIMGSFEGAAQGAVGLRAGSVFRVAYYAVVLSC